MVLRSLIDAYHGHVLTYSAQVHFQKQQANNRSKGLKQIAWMAFSCFCLLL